MCLSPSSNTVILFPPNPELYGSALAHVTTNGIMAGGLEPHFHTVYYQRCRVLGLGFKWPDLVPSVPKPKAVLSQESLFCVYGIIVSQLVLESGPRGTWSDSEFISKAKLGYLKRWHCLFWEMDLPDDF